MKITLRPNKLPILETKRLVLRDILVEDITETYVNWLNSPDVNKYLEVRFHPQTMESVTDFVKGKLADVKNSMHFGVYDTNGTRLIGTITLPHIRQEHGSSELSFVIGHPDASGKGYATEAVHAVCYFAFKHAGIAKLWGGYYDGHQASHRIFEKNGFQLEGRIRGELVDWQGNRVDHVLAGLLADEFVANPNLLGTLPPEIINK